MTVYLTLEQAIETHGNTIEVSGGGEDGKRQIEQLASVLEHIQNDDYYPTFEDKLTHLFFGACKFHCFVDGNKRIAITLTAQMLLFNGYMHCLDGFMGKMENISHHVASDAISKDLLHEIIMAVINKTDENEALKLKIYNAIKDSP
jgi:death-on-curing protein